MRDGHSWDRCLIDRPLNRGRKQDIFSPRLLWKVSKMSLHSGVCKSVRIRVRVCVCVCVCVCVEAAL